MALEEHVHEFTDRLFWGVIVRRCVCGAALDSRGRVWKDGEPED